MELYWIQGYCSLLKFQYDVWGIKTQKDGAPIYAIQSRNVCITAYRLGHGNYINRNKSLFVSPGVNVRIINISFNSSEVFYIEKLVLYRDRYQPDRI